MTQIRDLIKKMADFIKGEEFYEKGEDARLELSPDDVRCMYYLIQQRNKDKENIKREIRDIISRSDAIKAMQNKAKELKNENTINGLCGAVAILYELPSVTPQEPRKGHWVTRPHVYGATYCSECGFELKIDNTNYCPNCGCHMVEP